MSSDIENVRAAVFAAVTAHVTQDRETAGRILLELSTNPTRAVSAMTALVQVTSVAIEMWARAIQEEPQKAWRTLAQTIVLVLLGATLDEDVGVTGGEDLLRAALVGCPSSCSPSL